MDSFSICIGFRLTKYSHYLFLNFINTLFGLIIERLVAFSKSMLNGLRRFAFCAVKYNLDGFFLAHKSIEAETFDDSFLICAAISFDVRHEELFDGRAKLLIASAWAGRIKTCPWQQSTLRVSSDFVSFA